MRKGFWIAFWSVLAVAVGRGALTPAALRKGRVSGVSGAGPAYVGFSWGYGAGARPQSIIFDLELADGGTGSITTDGEATEAEVPFSSAQAGPYRLSAAATYRIVGVVHTRVYRFAGTMAG
jgi:hypothetical protein